jgi:D-3-phosphoglycerate dehydrogenase
MKPKVLIGTSSFGQVNPAPIKFLQENGLEVIPNPYGRKLTQEELIELLPGVDALIAGLETVDRKVLEASDLKVVSRCGAGISNVDVDACKQLDIIFKYTPFGPTQAVAELTVGMIIMLLRSSIQMNTSLHEKKWDKRVGFQLKKKTVSIIGYGKIGRRTASLLAPFDLNLIAIDPFLDPKEENITIMDLREALPISDIIVLHASGDEELIGEYEFSMMKPGVFLCNAARGQNINEPALIDALNNRTIAGVWLDSFSCEPYQGSLCDYPNVIMTPHVGSYTTEGRLEMEMETAQNLFEGLVEYGKICCDKRAE